MIKFFKSLIGLHSNKATQPDIPLGRYSDAYKSDQQQAAWDKAIELFEQGQPMDAYRSLLQHLTDPTVENLTWKDEQSMLTFEFWQGSRRIEGSFTGEAVTARTKIAYAPNLNVGFMRRLMELNFALRFCRYALSPDNHLCILFDSTTIDGSPVKIRQALRELAISADKQDDKLVDEFRMLQLSEYRPKESEISETEKAVKYAYLRQSVEAAFAEIDKGKPDPNTYPGGYAYLLLALAFRLDYLIRPEGFTMDTLERVHITYFTKDERTPQIKLQAMRKEFQKLLDRPQEEIYQELYRTRSTFGISPSVSQDRVRDLIAGELPNMDWNLHQKNDRLAEAVPEYLAGYMLFHYAPPKPVRALLELYFAITEAQFLSDLGFLYDLTDPVKQHLPYKKKIENAIQQIVSTHRAQYPYLNLNTKMLDYSSKALFGKTFLQLISSADLSK
jgi:hypothetical protein